MSSTLAAVQGRGFFWKHERIAYYWHNIRVNEDKDRLFVLVCKFGRQAYFASFIQQHTLQSIGIFVNDGTLLVVLSAIVEHELQIIEQLFFARVSEKKCEYGEAFISSGRLRHWGGQNKSTRGRTTIKRKGI